MPGGKPWGLRNSDTNYYTDYPITGVTREYDWTITKQACAPDGVNITCLMVNGQFPGPAIEANWGDNIRVKLTNNLTDEGTGIHWHGILQKGSQPYDGVPGVSICPIAPGSSFEYNFPAELYGSSYWHSHYSSQFASGLTGPVVVYGPNASTYDIDLGPAQLSDWYHDYYEDLLARLSVPLSESPEYPYSKNILINGKNPFDCSQAGDLLCEMAPISRFNLTSGKTHRLRLINTSAESLLKVSLDGHTLQVMANDFVEIEPYETNVVTLGVGQRTDVLIKGKTSSTQGAYWLRAVAPEGCAANNGQNVGKAAIYYEDADDSQLPFSSPWDDYDNSNCFNDPLEKTRPIMSLNPGEPGECVDINMEGHSNGTHGKWWMNNVTATVNYDDPILLRAKMGYTEFPINQNVYQYNSSVESVRFIVKNNNGNSHPMHLHGHNIFVLAEGEGDWDGTIVNPANPQRRDVQLVRPNGYLVIQWFQDNPGAWPFHCHIAWHLSLGMIIEVLESPELIHTQVKIPSTVSETCRNWWAFNEHSPIEVLDSGI